MKVKVKLRAWQLTGIVVLGLVLVILVFTAFNLWQLKKASWRLGIDVRQAQSAWQAKDLGKTTQAVAQAKRDLVVMLPRYRQLHFWHYCPWLGRYYDDGQHLLLAGQASLEAGQQLLAAIEPYQDFLGFGTRQGDGAKTAADRIQFLVETVASLEPKLDNIGKQLVVANQNLQAVDAGRYPEKWHGYQLRAKIAKAQELMEEITRLSQEGQPLIKKAAWLLGEKSNRYYLVIFQNDGELRPTGGFWTAYGVFRVKKGQIYPLVSSDIYTLDRRFQSPLTPPPLLARYLKVSRWHLRDMNTSPDFAKSVERFLPYYQKLTGQKHIDGVIAVDTQVLVDLLRVLGQIGVPGWGNFSAQPDPRCFGCPQVVYQLEMLADRPRSTFIANRKGFLGPVLHSLLSNVIGSPRQRMAALTAVFWRNLEEKHILLYFPDINLEKAVSKLGFGGRLLGGDGDYLQINDSNLGGAKANLFIKQKVLSEYYRRQGKLYKKITVTYTNPAPASNCNLEKGDLCLNGAYRDWFRFYLPTGTKLVRLTGSEIKPTVSQELNKTVVSGFFGVKNPLYPRSKLVISAEVELPFNKNSFKLWWQKQPGKKEVEETIKVNGRVVYQEKLHRDRVFSITF